MSAIAEKHNKVKTCIKPVIYRKSVFPLTVQTRVTKKWIEQNQESLDLMFSMHMH